MNNVVKIKWIITDAIEAINLEEFCTEWDGIYGYFKICINNQVLGFCPDRELISGEEGNENILYWLFKLSDGIIQINNKKKYEIQLLSMNLVKIIIEKKDKLIVNFVNSNTEELIWSEEITLQELCDEIKCNIEDFVSEIRKNNSALLEADLIKQLLITMSIL